MLCDAMMRMMRMMMMMMVMATKGRDRQNTWSTYQNSRTLLAESSFLLSAYLPYFFVRRVTLNCIIFSVQ